MTTTRIHPHDLYLAGAIVLALLPTNPVAGAAVLAIALVAIRAEAHPVLVAVATALMTVLLGTTLMFFLA